MEQVTVQLSALEHFGYCPRQCGLVAVEGQWLDNRHTAAGSVAHKRVDSAPARVERGVSVLVPFRNGTTNWIGGSVRTHLK